MNVPHFSDFCHIFPKERLRHMTQDHAHRPHPDHPASLVRVDRGGVVVHTDEHLLATTGVLIAFTERSGGVSAAPYDSLNLASHVDDDPHAVDVNRDRLFDALGLKALRGRLVTAEQVHGEHVQHVTAAHAGAGAHAAAGMPPVPGTDALFTTEPGLPLMLFFADCVPVVLVAHAPQRAVAVVHAGWRGALASLPGRVALSLATEAGCDPSSLFAYVGPHIRRCCYEVDETLLSQFCNNFDTIGAVDGHLDLAAAVRESLTRVGVAESRIVESDQCTRDHTDRFYSYRAAPVTGRHGALAVIIEGEYT